MMMKGGIDDNGGAWLGLVIVGFVGGVAIAEDGEEEGTIEMG